MEVVMLTSNSGRNSKGTLGVRCYVVRMLRCDSRDRDFSILQSFSVSFSILGLLPSIASTLPYALGYSGTGGTVWGWLIAAIMIQSTAFSMAELCSAMPTAGGLYYAAAVLAPDGWGPIASWFVGWSNFCGFVTGPCSLNYALGGSSVGGEMCDER